MRKMVAVVLVFGLASMAGATAVGGFALSVNGATDVEEYGMLASEEMTLDIHVLDGTELAGFVLIVQVTGQGSLDASNVVFEETPATHQYVDVPGIFTGWTTTDRAWGSGDVAVAVAEPQVLRFSAGNLDFNTVGPYVLMDELVFHLDGAAEALIELIAMDSTYYTHVLEGEDIGRVDQVHQLYDSGVVVDSIVARIPEPITLSLLAMGGLALLRRRR